MAERHHMSLLSWICSNLNSQAEDFQKKKQKTQKSVIQFPRLEVLYRAPDYDALTPNTAKRGIFESAVYIKVWKHTWLKKTKQKKTRVGEKNYNPINLTELILDYWNKQDWAEYAQEIET